jgi:hypothetical protein
VNTAVTNNHTVREDAQCLRLWISKLVANTVPVFLSLLQLRLFIKQKVPQQQRLSGFDTLTVAETSVISGMLTAGTCVPYEWPWSSIVQP